MKHVVTITKCDMCGTQIPKITGPMPTAFTFEKRDICLPCSGLMFTMLKNMPTDKELEALYVKAYNFRFNANNIAYCMHDSN